MSESANFITSAAPDPVQTTRDTDPTMTIGASLSVSFLVERTCRRNRVRGQLKTVLRISHHCGFAGISITTVAGRQSHFAAPNEDRRWLRL
jgi:hypothetical protein